MEKTGHAQFGLTELREEDLYKDPFRQFETWYEEASAGSGLRYPDAFALATVSPDMKPSLRMLLLKGVDEKGFVFFTNSESRKGEELSGNLNAAMCFWWEGIERQVRIEGAVEMLPGSDSDDYFASRPRGSQLGAWASEQSRVIPGREYLEERYRALEEKYENSEVSRPPYWNGYRLVPVSIEFWQGRPDRLHDRIRYTKLPSGEWLIERLAP